MSFLSEKEFEIKYKLYAQELMNVCYGYTKDKYASEDLVQNVFIKFLNSNKVFNSDLEEKYWLLRVAINECKNYIRSRVKIVYNEDVINFSIKEKEVKDEKILFVSEFVKGLPEKYRSVIVLFYYDSLSINDISNTFKDQC